MKCVPGGGSAGKTIETWWWCGGVGVGREDRNVVVAVAVVDVKNCIWVVVVVL